MLTDGVLLIDALSKEYDGCWSAIVQTLSSREKVVLLQFLVTCWNAEVDMPLGYMPLS
jgi:hypothetical protein